MRKFDLQTLAIAAVAFAAPYGLQYTPIPKLVTATALKDPLSAEQIAALDAALTKTDDDLGDARTVAGDNGGTLVGALAAAREQQLLLTHAMIDNRLRAARGEAPTELAVPTMAPDPAKAAKIKEKIKTVEAEIADATHEATLYSGGLVLAMIMSRLETAKLQLAQLQSGLYQAELGVAMTVDAPRGAPGLSSATAQQGGEPAAVPDEPAAAAPPEAVGSLPTVAERPSWADPNFPDIDYTDSRFSSFANEGMKLSGWWAVKEEKAPIDDSLTVTAINLSAIEQGMLQGDKLLYARCKEGETSIVFNADTYLMSDYDSYTLPTIYRLDDQPPVSSNWSTLTSNEGVGLFGAEAITFLKRLDGAKKLFVRVTEKNGQTHDAVFLTDGLSPANEKIKQACKW